MPGTGEVMSPTAFDSQPLAPGASDTQRRVQLARWVTSPENPWFAKAYTNHVWARLIGQGFTDPVDDIGEGAFARLPELHSAVAEHFVATGYDTKQLIRLIASTRFYARDIRPSPASLATIWRAVTKLGFTLKKNGPRLRTGPAGRRATAQRRLKAQARDCRQLQESVRIVCTAGHERNGGRFQTLRLPRQR